MQTTSRQNKNDGSQLRHRVVIMLLLSVASLLPVSRAVASEPKPTECTPGENHCLPTREQCATGNYNGFWDGGDDDRFATCLGAEGVVIAYAAGSFGAVCGDAAAANVGVPGGVDPNTCETPSRQAKLVSAAQAVGLNECAERLWGDTEAETKQWDPPEDRPVSYTHCTGEILSHDGLELDARLTFPTAAEGPLPTIALLHGWAGDRVFVREPTTLPYVSKGYATLAYTARGFGSSCGMLDAVSDVDTAGGTNPLEEEDPAHCVRGWTHLAEREWEVKDSQHVLGLLVDSGAADPARLAAVGESYGAGQAWMLATSLPWATPNGSRTIQLAAAVPLYGWTDLANALAPNGRASDGAHHSASREKPFGVSKQSWSTSLFGPGRTPVFMINGVPSVYSPMSWGHFNRVDPTEKHSFLEGWLAVLNAGEPYDTPANWLPEAFRGKSAYHSDAYFDALSAKTVSPVPILAVQGWNDTLFPAVEGLQMYRKLKAADPQYPITVGVVDAGHAVSQNPAHVAEVKRRTHDFLDRQLLRAKPAAPGSGVFSLRTTCVHVDATAFPAIESAHLDALAPRVTILTSDQLGTTTSHPPSAGHVDADPVTRMNEAAVHGATHRWIGATPEPCVTASPSAAPPSGARWRWTLGRSKTLLGLPRVEATYAMEGADATVVAKLWDVSPAGDTRTLVTRGVYRLSTLGGDPATGRLAFQLFGNHWEFEPGHNIELELSQSDTPFLRPDNLPSTIQFSEVQLSLPESAAAAAPAAVAPRSAALD